MSVRIDKQLCPELRLKSLLDFSGKVEIDSKVSTKLYYKSGLNMFKQFNIYYIESNWENALCIYLKYEKLFFDKIKQHPNYSKVPVNVKAINAANFRVIKPKAEHSKRELFKQYKRDYVSLLEELKTNKIQQIGGISEESIAKDMSGIAKTQQNERKRTTILVNPETKTTKETEIGLNLQLLDYTIKSEASFETSRRMTEHENLRRAMELQEVLCENSKGGSKKLATGEKRSSNMVTPPKTSSTSSETAKVTSFNIAKKGTLL